MERGAAHALAPRPPSLRSAPCPSSSLTDGRLAARGLAPMAAPAARAPALILLLVYVGLSFLNDPRGSLGTDTGGKVATLVAMDRQRRPRSRRRLLGGRRRTPTPRSTASTTRPGSATGTSTSPRCRWCWPPSRSTTSAATAWRCCCRCSGRSPPPSPARAIARRVGPRRRVDGLLGGRPGLAAGHLRARLLGAQHRRGAAWPGARSRSTTPCTTARPGGGAWPPAPPFGAAFSMRTEALAYGFAMVGGGLPRAAGRPAATWPGRCSPGPPPWSAWSACSWPTPRSRSASLGTHVPRRVGHQRCGRGGRRRSRPAAQGGGGHRRSRRCRRSTPRRSCSASA